MTVTYDIQEGQLVRLFHGRPDKAWEIEELIKEERRSAMTEEQMQELAAYIEAYIWRERQDEGNNFYTSENMVLKAMQAYQGETK